MIEIRTFRGLSADTSPEGNPPDSARDLQNVEITDEYRSVKGSVGASVLLDDQMVAAAVNGLHDFRRKEGSHEVLALNGENIYKEGAAAWGALTKDTGVTFIAGGVLSAVTLQDKVFGCDNVSQPFYYDGTKVYRWGFEGPANQAIITVDYPYVTVDYPYVADGAAASNNDSGLHEVMFTFYNTSGAESHPSKIMRYEVTDASPLKILLHTGYSQNGGATIPAVPSWANRIRVWMTHGGDPCSFYLVTTITPSGGNAEETHSIDIADASLTTSWDDFGGPPPTIHGVFKFGPDQSRIGVYGSDEFLSRLWWTNPDDPFKFEDSNFADFGADDGDRIQACAQLRSGVIILKRNSTWALFGAGPTTYYSTSQSARLGCGARYSLVVHQGEGYYLSYNGAYKSTGIGEPQNISEGRIRKWVQNLNWSGQPDLIRGGYIPELDQIWWSVPYGAAQGTPNKVLILDMRSGEWLIRNQVLYSLSTEMETDSETSLFGTSEGYVLKLDSSTYNWNTVAQNMYWESQWIEVGKLLECRVNHDTQSSGELTVLVTGVDVEDDANALTRTFTVDMTEPRPYRFPCPMTKRLVKVRVSNAVAAQTFGVRGIDLWTTEIGRRGRRY